MTRGPTCVVCGKGNAEVAIWIRQNPKGEPGKWACVDCSQVKPDPLVDAVVSAIANDNHKVQNGS